MPCWQNPFDVWIIQEIIDETRPDTIVETGTLAGGGALLWASLLSMFGDGRVLTIDLREEWHEAAASHPLAKERITFVRGSSTDAAVFDSVARDCSGRSTMVILDSDHSADHVYAELEMWSRLISPGNYLVVQDGIVTYVDENRIPGPLEAVGRWMPNHPEFEIDEARERMLFTLCPSGSSDDDPVDSGVSVDRRSVGNLDIGPLASQRLTCPSVRGARMGGTCGGERMRLWDGGGDHAD